MDSHVKLAKETIDRYIIENKVIEIPKNLPADFYSRRAGVFVTIYNNGELRGCIGTFLPTRENLAEEIIQNAVSACSADYRFDPIGEAELAEIYCEVSVLSEPVAVQNLAAHDVRQHGIIVQSGRRRGLLLPDLESVNTTQQQIAIAAEKGGIDPEKDPITLFEFTAEKHR